MSNSNIKDDKQMGNNDKDQRDKDQKTGTGADKQPAGQRQQSTGQPGSPGSGQQGGQNDNRTQQGGPGTQQGGSGAGKSSDSDPNRKGGGV